MKPRCLIWSSPQGGIGPELSYGKSEMYRHCETWVHSLRLVLYFFPWAHHLSRSNWPITMPGSSVSTAPSLECQCIFSSNPPFREEIQLCDSYKPYSKSFENNVFGAQWCFGTGILDDIFTHLKFAISMCNYIECKPYICTEESFICHIYTTA